jgi:NAD-dependent DNA ligase
MLNTTSFQSYDTDSHSIFCGPAQLHKDLNTLYGYIVGIQADGHINETEIELLHSWINSIGTLRTKAPYFKLVNKINEIISDGIVTEEEAEDLIWLCRSYLDYNSPYYDVITSSAQKLSGFLAGISADKSINIEELTTLGIWTSENASLTQVWPFDTLVPIIVQIETEKQLSTEQQSQLLDFCQSVCNLGSPQAGKKSIAMKLSDYKAAIVIQESTFCFTGKSEKYSREELAQIVEMYGGVATNSITAKLQYLVVCEKRNPAWAFEMYGRKVEKAMNMKKKGAGPEVVFEEDLLAALSEFGFKSA